MTPISITNKANCHRKTHRINIPIQVIIANTTYSVLDWSTQGLKVNYPSDNLNIDEKIDITFILPTGDSSILLKAEVILRSINHEDYGFEILKLSDKNQRVLRHYATLSIDGNHNHVDNLSGDLFMTDVISPIHEPIVLSEKEHHAVHKSFLKRVISYLFFGILFFILVIVTFFYNYIILYESTGLISGNAKHYSAPKEGMLKAVYVTNAQKLTKNQLLFEMDVRIEEDLLKNLRKHKALLKKQLQRAKAMIRD
ncbi:MAG: PilZ domain-containing protein, partial [Campylobacterota bacterium]|nr:PilZ domain-containing protein [Campylobacterota bacterium]